MGSAALYQLSKRGVSVIGIDQFSPPHSFGSSHGDTRITRQAIGEGEAYTPLALRSHELWKQIQAEAKASGLLNQIGGLILASPRASSEASETTVHGSHDFLGSTLASARKFSIAHDVLTTKEIQARYPAFRLYGETGYFEPGAGFLRPEACITAQLDLARQNGAHLHTDEKAAHFNEAGGEITLHTDKSTYRAKKLIVTAGPWVRDFLPAPQKQLFTVHRQVLYWFDVADNYTAFVPERFPVFIWDFGTGDSIYGFPALDGPNGGLKIAHEEYAGEANPAQINRTVTREETDRMYEEFVAPRLNGVSPLCVKSVCCPYTVTPDFGFVLDTHPDCKNVFVASPCSGHGFKHSAAIGEIIADWAVDEKSKIDREAFSLRRFGRGTL